MKEVVSIKTSLERLSRKALLIEGLKQLAAVLCGFCAAKGVISQSIIPFGLSLAAAVPPSYIAMTTLGCFLGYFIPAIGSGAFRYIAALFAITAIKALLASVTKYATRPFISAVVALAATLATGLVNSAGDTSGSLMALAEAVFAFGGAYFISHAFKTVLPYRNGLKGEELTSLLIFAGIILTGLIGFNIGGISLGRIAGVALVLLSSRFGGTFAGTVSGATFGIAAVFAGAKPYLSAVILFSSLLAGAFSSRGKYLQVAAFIISAALGGLLGEDLTAHTAFLIEAFFGSAVFLCFPKTVAMRLGKLFSPPTRTISENGMKKSVTMRLKYAAGALSDVSDTVESVAKELSRINSPSFEQVLDGVEKEACSGCSLCINCWEQRKSDTVSAVLDIIKAVKENKSGGIDDAPDEFRGRCLRPARVSSAVLKYYTDYASRTAAERRLGDVRNVVSDQFGGISNMLNDLAAELNRDESFDERLAVKIAAALKNIDIRAEECGVRLDKYGRMSIEIILKRVSGVKYNRMKILRQVEVCCDRDFEPPAINYTADTVYITLTEKALISLDLGAHQISSSPSGVCGDAYSWFSDGKGRIFMILSDGMGSGGRAAVDGAMASGLMSRLLKAGFGYDCSLKLVNSAMLFKSTDESLATVDVSCIDLFSGRTDLLKAGAAPTVIRRNGKSGKAQSTSLPAGILREVGFDKATVKLSAGDVIVMMSDGASGEGTEWISAELEAFKGGRAQELAEHIARCAKRRRSDNHEDDITVLVGIVEKAV